MATEMLVHTGARGDAAQSTDTLAGPACCSLVISIAAHVGVLAIGLQLSALQRHDVAHSQPLLPIEMIQLDVAVRQQENEPVLEPVEAIDESIPDTSEVMEEQSQSAADEPPETKVEKPARRAPQNRKPAPSPSPPVKETKLLDFSNSLIAADADNGAGKRVGTTHGGSPIETRGPSSGGAGSADSGAQRGALKSGKPSLYRAPTLHGSRQWNCPWPREARSHLSSHEVVVLRAWIDSKGHAKRVEIKSGPGKGFERAATTCVLAREFSPGRDRDGNNEGAFSPWLRIHFRR